MASFCRFPALPSLLEGSRPCFRALRPRRFAIGLEWFESLASRDDRMTTKDRQPRGFRFWVASCFSVSCWEARFEGASRRDLAACSAVGFVFFPKRFAVVGPSLGSFWRWVNPQSTILEWVRFVGLRSTSRRGAGGAPTDSGSAIGKERQAPLASSLEPVPFSWFFAECQNPLAHPGAGDFATNFARVEPRTQSDPTAKDRLSTESFRPANLQALMRSWMFSVLLLQRG